MHIFNMSTTGRQGFKKIHLKLWEELITQTLHHDYRHGGKKSISELSTIPPLIWSYESSQRQKQVKPTTYCQPSSVFYCNFYQQQLCLQWPEYQLPTLLHPAKKYQENTTLVSFDMKFIRRDQKQPGIAKTA